MISKFTMVTTLMKGKIKPTIKKETASCPNSLTPPSCLVYWIVLGPPLLLILFPSLYNISNLGSVVKVTFSKGVLFFCLNFFNVSPFFSLAQEVFHDLAILYSNLSFHLHTLYPNNVKLLVVSCIYHVISLFQFFAQIIPSPIF